MSDLRSGYYQDYIAKDGMCDMLWIIRLLGHAFCSHKCTSYILHPHKHGTCFVPRSLCCYLNNIVIYSKSLDGYV